MRVLLTRDFPGSVADRTRERFDAVLRDGGPLGPEEAAAALREHDAIPTTIGDDWSETSFVERPRCRLLANFGVGHDHIDTEAARRAGVVVTNTPGPTTEPARRAVIRSRAARRASRGRR